jgi:hypothetical protein
MNPNPSDRAGGPRGEIKLSLGLPEWLLAFFLTAFTFPAYQPAWRRQPLWDDTQHMATTLGGLARTWWKPGVTRRFDPPVDTTFWIERKLWEAAPLGYHLVSIICHVGAALLLVAVLRRLHIGRVWLAAGRKWSVDSLRLEFQFTCRYKADAVCLPVSDAQARGRMT